MVLSVDNNNPGNIRDAGIPWEGRTGSRSGFVTFATPSLGVRAMTRNLYSYQNRGLTSVRDMISTWAPPSENDTNGYVNFVASRMGVDPNAPINLRNNPALTQSMVSAMIQMEGGTAASSYFAPHIASGVSMANGTTDPDSAPATTATPTPEDTASPEEVTTDAESIETESRRASSRTAPFYEENILNQYESYTYRWGIHMCHPMEADQFEDLIDRGRVVTIAESGVENEISIDRVTQDMVLTFAQENRNSVANQFNIDFTEVNGATMFTRILQAALSLGIENHLQACYLLELNFTGWLPDGTAVEQIAGPYYYMTTLTSLTFNFQNGASTYAGQFIETTQDAYRRLDYHLREDVVISASTFGEFLTEFERVVNEQAELQAFNARNQLLPNIYHFGTGEGGEEWQGWSFDAVDGGDINLTRGISVSGSGTLQFSLAQGTAITAAMAMALFQTTNMKRIMTENGFAKENPDEGEADADKLAEMVRWITFNTDVKYLAYDVLLKHYQKDITYLAKPYVAPEAIHDPASFVRLLGNEQNQRDRLRRIFQDGLLRKRFDYTYTGLNTEVIDLDIQLNNSYFTLQALNSGVVTFPDSVFVGSGSELQREIAALKGRVQSIQDSINRLRSDRSRLQSEADELGESITGVGDPNLDRLQGLNSQIAALDTQIASETRTLTEVSEVAQREFGTLLDRVQEQTTARNLPALQRRYLTQDELYSKRRIDELLPVTFEYFPLDSLTTQGPDKGISDIGTVMLGALEVNLNSLADLVQQTIMVRGDPYWLGRPRGAEASNQANYDYGGLGYFLNIEFPTYPSESTGLQDQQTSFMISGFYRVYQVQARYENGSFNMILQSFRDSNTNVDILYEDLLFGNVQGG